MAPGDPAEQQQPGQPEPERRHQERWHGVHRDGDGQVGRAPDAVQDGQPDPDRGAVRRVAPGCWHSRVVQGHSIALDGRRAADQAAAVTGRRSCTAPVAGGARLGQRPERPPVALQHVAARAAGRPAHDAGRGAAEEALAAPRRVLHGVRVEALGRQDRALVPGSTERVLANRSVGTDHAVTRHDERDRVVAERGPDGAHGPRPPDLRGDPAVRPDLAARDLERLPPDVLLEWAVAAQVQRDADSAVTVEPAGDGALEAGRQLATDRPAAGRRQVTCLERGVVGGDVDGRHAAAVPGDDERPQRRLDAGVPVDEADLDQHRRAQRRRRRRGEVGELGRLGLRGFERHGHAVISSGSRRASVSSMVRSRAIPRWTWALTVPSGRPRAAAASG